MERLFVKLSIGKTDLQRFGLVRTEYLQIVPLGILILLLQKLELCDPSKLIYLHPERIGDDSDKCVRSGHRRMFDLLHATLRRNVRDRFVRYALRCGLYSSRIRFMVLQRLLRHKKIAVSYKYKKREGKGQK